MSGAKTDPITLREDIDRCFELNRETRQLYDSYKTSLMNIINNNQVNKELNAHTIRLDGIEKNQKKFLQIGEFLLNHDIEQAINDIDQIKESINKAKGKINQLHREDKSLNTKIVESQTKIGDHDNSLLEISNFINNEDNRQERLKEKILDEAKIQCNNSIDALNEKIDSEHQEKLNLLDDDHKNRLRELLENIQRVENQASDSIEKLRNDHEDAINRIEQAEEFMNQTNNTITSIQDKMKEDSDRIDELIENFNSMNEKINQIYDKINLIEEEIQTNKHQSELEDQNIHDEINQFKQQVEEQDQNNQNAFDGVNEEITNLKNEDNRIEQKLDEGIDDLNKKIQQSEERANENLSNQFDRLVEMNNKSKDEFNEFVETNDRNLQNINELIDAIHQTEEEMKQNHNDLEQNHDLKIDELTQSNNDIVLKFYQNHEKLISEVLKCNRRNEEIYNTVLRLQGNGENWKDVSMTDFGTILENTQNKVDDTLNEIKNNIKFADEKMNNDLQIVNEAITKKVESLQNQIDNQKESIQQVLSEQIQNSKDQFHQIMNEMNFDSIQTRQLLCQFFDIDPKILTITLNQTNTENSDTKYNPDENKKKNLVFQTNLPKLIQMITSVDERAQDSSKTLNEELNDLSKSIFEELETYEILRSEVEKRNKDLDTFKDIFTVKVNDITSRAEEVKISSENVNQNLLLIQDQLEQTKNRMDRTDDQIKNDLELIRNQIEFNDNSIKSSIQSRFETFSTSYKESIGQIEGNWQELHRRIDAMFGSSSMSFDQFVEEMKKVREEANRFINIEDRINQKVEQIRNEVKAYADNSGELNGQTMNEINELKIQMQTKIDNNAKIADQQLRTAKIELQQAIEKADKKFVNFFGSENPKFNFIDIFLRIKEVDDNSKNADVLLNNRIDEFEKSVNGNFSKFATTCLKLNKNIEVRKSEIENLQKKTKNGFTEIEAQINTEKAQVVNQIKQKHDETLLQLNEIQKSYADIRNSINDVSDESHNLMNELENNYNDLLFKSQEIISDLIEPSFKIVNDNFNELRKTVNAIKGKDGYDFPSILKKISSMEKKLQAQIDGIQEFNSQVNQDISNAINDSKAAVNERIDQLIIDSNAKVENLMKNAENQNLQNLQKIEKLNSNFTSKLKQLDEKIISLDGDSGVNLKTLYDAFNELNLSVHAEFTKAASEINKIKKNQERQQGIIKDELTNEFKLIVNSKKLDDDQLLVKLDSIHEVLKEYATSKSLQELEKKVSDLEENQIDELIRNQESIANEMTEYSVKLKNEVQKRLEKHQKKLSALKESVNRINGDAGQSLEQTIEKVNNIEKDLILINSNVSRLQNSTTEEAKKRESQFVSEVNKLNVQLEEMRQKYTTDSKKIAEEVTENSRLIQEHKTSFENYIKNLENQTKDQFLRYEQQNDDKYSAFTALFNNKISKIDNEINITKSSFEKVNKHQIAFSRSTKDSIESLRTYVDSRFELSSKALENMHIEISNEVNKLLTEKSTAIENFFREENKKATDSLSELKEDFEKLRCGSMVSIPMIVDQIKSVSDLVKKKENENESKIKNFDEKIALVEQNSFEKTKQKSSKLKSLIKSLQEQTSNNKDQFDDAILEMQGAFRKELKEMERRLTVIINGNKEFVDSSIKKISEDNKISMAKADSQFSKIDILFSKVDTRLISMEKDEKNHFAEFFRKMSDKVNDRNAKNLEQVNKSIQKVRIELQEKVDEMTDLTNKLHFSFNDAQAKNDQISVQNREIIGSFTKSELSGFLDQFKDSLQNKLNNVKKKVEETYDIIEELRSETKISVDTVDSKIELTNNKLNELKNSISKQLKSALDDVSISTKKANDNYDSLIQTNNDQFKKFKEEFTSLFEDKKFELVNDITQRNDAIYAEFVTIKTYLKLKTEELEKDISDLQEDLKTSVRPSIKKINGDIESLSSELKEYDQKASNSISDIFMKFENSSKYVKNLEKFVTDSENQINELSKSVKLDFIAARNDIDSVSNKVVHDISEMQASVDVISRDILDLKRIKHLNARHEEINMKIEDSLHQDVVSINGRPLKNENSPDNKIQKLMKKEPFSPSKKDKFYIKGKRKDNSNSKDTEKANELYIIEKDTEIGEILRETFKTHNNVVLIIPEKKKVYWNKSVSLLPNQSLEIQGERMSSIQMEGFSEVGGKYDLSRVVIDGFGYFKIQNVKVQVKCNLPLPLFSCRTPKSDSNEKYLSCLNFGALFVSRCWDASGPGAIIIESCSFETDVPIVNIGANSFCHVKISESGLTTRVKVNSRSNEDEIDSIIYPITCDNGGYNQGYGSVSIRNVNVASPRLKWLNSQYIIQPDVSFD